MAIKLNVANGFVMNDFWTATPYDTYINNDMDVRNYTMSGKYNLCYRFIASGGVPPYTYSMIGNTPPEIGLYNRPRLSGFYDEFADLTILSPVTFNSDMAGTKSVAIIAKDSTGDFVTVTGSVVINLKQTLPIKIQMFAKSTHAYSLLQPSNMYLVEENTTLRLPAGMILPKWVYFIRHRDTISIEFHVTGSFKSRRPTMKVYGKQRALSFEQIDQPEGATTLKWKLYGMVEGSRRESFEDMTVIFKDGDDVYPPIDLMCVVQADPTL